MTTKYVLYFRVSTTGQGKSGLGLDAQKRDVDLFLSNYSAVPYEVVAEYTDVMSGSREDRPALQEAITKAKEEGAELLVAKLDRLSRKVSFIATLLDDKKLILRVASMPNADKFQLHIYAALAEQERDFISLRTKQALTEAKARGVKLGGFRDQANARLQAVKDGADADAQRVAGIIMPMRQARATYQAIADALNAAGMTTPRGSQWTPNAVRRAEQRLLAIAA